MRTLPWLLKKDESAEKSLKRKRNMQPDIPSSQVKLTELVEIDSQRTTPEPTKSEDVMIPGYDHDDAYIMVEDDLLAAAKQITRHLHQEAYQRHATTTVTGEIVRPTTSAPRRRPEIEDEAEEDSSDGEGKDASTLGELLRQKPPAPSVAATPIKRTDVLTAKSLQRRRSISPAPMAVNKNNRVGLTKETRVVEIGTDDDEDDEDLDRPRKKVSTVRPF
jgi:hypothetical protein